MADGAATSEPVAAAVARLAALAPLDYDRARADEAARLGVRKGTLDREVRALRRAQTGAVEKRLPGLTPLSSRGSGGWLPLLREPFAGAWQTNYAVSVDSVLSYSAVFRCISLIASDIAKMRIHLSVIDPATGIWSETTNAAHSPVLRKPNRYQNRIRFFSNWMESVLIHGNAYILKQRDNRNVVVALYVLDPNLVTVLVAHDGAVYYQLRRDDLAGLNEERDIVVPAREIIHDLRFAPWHPLVGVSPITACGLAATQGLKIQDNSTRFFASGSRPSGVLTAPGFINEETAARLKLFWEQNYSGQNVGKVAVLGDGLKYEPMTMTAVDAQLLEQLKWTGEMVATVFGVPPYKLGIVGPPTYNNVEALDQQYYSQCLQIHIESIELALDEGLELPSGLGTEFDLDGLIRMDTPSKVKASNDAVGGGWMSPNEARRRSDLPPVEGGETPYLQQQYWPLSSLSGRELPATPGTEPVQIAEPGNAEGTPSDDGGDERSEAAERGAVIDFSAWLAREAERVVRKAAELGRSA